MRSRFCVLLAGACAVLGMSAWPAAAGTVAATAASASAQQVTYLGHTFTVPASWQVVNLAARPTACVRFDRHVIYLGTPSASQQCPANVIGKTEAILAEPAGAAPAGAPASDAVSHDIVATAPGIRVHATYGSDRATVTAILSAAGITDVVPAAATRAPAAAGATPAATPATVSATSTNFHGKGFDACAVPSSGTMSAWRSSSPYAAVGIYIGGADRACAQPNLTSGWVSQQAAAGWHFIPLWVGPEAEFGQITSPASQGTANAQDAAGEAASLGFSKGSVLYYDMEGYPSSQSSNALGFESAWTKELHALGYMSGVYSSDSSGIADLVNHKSSYTMPDVIDDADWNGQANTSLPSVPARDWANHQRIHQYSGGNNETYGGATINIDQDYLDVAVAPNEPQVIGHLASVVDSSLGDSVDLFGIGANGTAFEKTWKPASGWSAWQNLGGVFTGSLTPVVDATMGKSVDLFGTGTTGTAFEAHWTPSSGWSAWGNLGGTFSAPLTAVADPSLGKSVDVFGIGTNGTAFEKTWSLASGWSGWQNMGGVFAGSLDAMADPTLGQSVDLFGTGTTGTAFEKTWKPASGWSPWRNFGGTFGQSVTAVADPTLGQSVDAFGVGSTGTAFGAGWKPATGWASWSNMGGVFGAGLTGVADPTLGKSVDVFGIGATGTAFERTWKPATGWSAWQNLGGTFTG
jgi:hypothetical protein